MELPIGDAHAPFGQPRELSSLVELPAAEPKIHTSGGAEQISISISAISNESSAWQDPMINAQLLAKQWD